MAIAGGTEPSLHFPDLSTHRWRTRSLDRYGDQAFIARSFGPPRVQVRARPLDVRLVCYGDGYRPRVDLGECMGAEEEERGGFYSVRELVVGSC